MTYDFLHDSLTLKATHDRPGKLPLITCRYQPRRRLPRPRRHRRSCRGRRSMPCCSSLDLTSGAQWHAVAGSCNSRSQFLYSPDSELAMLLCRPFDSGKIAVLVVTLGETMTTVNMSDINVLGTSQVPGLRSRSFTSYIATHASAR